MALKRAESRANPDSFKREMMNFGIEVVKFPRSGAPAPRVIHLSLDPLQIYWVGKGGKRKWINLNDVVFLRCGVFISNTNFSYPAEGFKKSGVPSNCECYVSMGMNEDDRESLDVEFSSPDHARLFASVMESILPNLVGKEAKA